MRKLYSLVLMATALLIGTNVWAANEIQLKKSNGTTSTFSKLQTAFENADDGSTITMLGDYTFVSKELITIGNKTAEEAGKTITLDFKGNKVYGAGKMIDLYRGTLILKNSVPAQEAGLFSSANSKYRVIDVYGTIEKECNPRLANSTENPYYAHLVIEEGVTIKAEGAQVAKSGGEDKANGGICVMVLPVQKTTFNGVSVNALGAMIYTNDNTDLTKIGSNPRGVANGVRIDVKGNLQGSLYAMQTNGQLACYKDDYATYYNQRMEDFYGAGANVPASITDTAYAPYIYIHESAKLSNVAVTSVAKGTGTKAPSISDADLVPFFTKAQVGLYTSGYARWYVEGSCDGSTGLYMKSGSVVLNDATITSNYKDDADLATGKTNGVNGAGNAIVVESNGHYSGNCVLDITGDTKVSTEADGGTALAEVIAQGTTSAVEEITINGGTFSGDNAIAISDETSGNKVVTVAGSNLAGAVDPSTLTEIISNGSHATTVGNTTIISTGKDAPAEIQEWTAVAELASGTNANWTGFTAGVIDNGETVKLGELQIISGNATNGVQQLTINNGGVLVVDKLIMNDYARIIVEAGGMLIVTGTLGINAPVFENILLKSTATEQAIFLFNPAVSSNKYPKATVQLTSKAYKIGDNNYAWQRFAVPTHVGYEVKRNDMQYDKTNYPTAIYKRVYSPDGWEVLAPASEEAYVPFLCYNMTTNVDHVGAVYTFQCEMAGNVNAELPLLGEKWSYYGNSYTAPIDLATMIPSLPATVSKTVYVHNVGEDYWDAVNVGDIEDNEMAQTQINPMQAFVYQKRGEGTSTILDYENWVYEPAKAKANLAPARRISSSVDYQRATIVMTAEDGSQEIAKLYQGARFANTYDDGYDAEKLMSENHFNMYINAEEGEMTRWATDEIENATINMQTKQATSYTMSFKNVTLEGYAVKDNLTGTTVEIMDGNTYHFSTLANANVEGRFEIVGRQNMPTAIDNTEAVKSVKGIYTITGQYVGEENVWNTLPAGVYVVNGMKMVK